MNNVDSNVVILGAGFSLAASGGQTPLMRGFFDRLDQREHADLFRFVEANCGDVKNANVEEVLLYLDQIGTTEDRALEGWAADEKRKSELILTQLESYCLDRLNVTGDYPEYSNWAHQVVGSLSRSTTVISLNYDTIAEMILSNRSGMVHAHQSPNPTCPHCKMKSLLEKACSCSKRHDITECDWKGALLKLHGSISWKRCKNRECCLCECLVADAQCQPFEACSCESCAELCKSVLVMPSMSKHLDAVPEIHIMWQAARLALSEASRILLIGFSMPDSDKLLEMMIRRSLEKNSRLKSVACIDLNPKAVLNRFKRCVSPSSSIEFHEITVSPETTPHIFDQFFDLGYCTPSPMSVMPVAMQTANGNERAFFFPSSRSRN